MKPFLRDVMTALGAKVRDDDGALCVELPEEGDGALLAKRLGRSELALVFDSESVGAGRELVAPGSQVLRVIDEFLDPRAVRAYLLEPGTSRLTRKVLRTALSPARGLELSLENRRPAPGYTLHVVYRLRYRSIERVDSLETIRVETHPGQAPIVTSAAPGTGSEGWQSKPRKQAPDDVLAEALAAADRHVTELARVKGKEARERVRKRFSKDLSRLHAYYSGQVAEYRRRRNSELSEMRIEELEEEREVRIKELVAASEVEVEVAPLQILTIERPLQAADVVVRVKNEEDTGEGPPRLTVVFDRAGGALSVPPCPACAGSFSAAIVAPCAGGHVVHEECVAPCERCERASCDACEGGACGSCHVRLCPECAQACPACEAVACAEHLVACAECALAGCGACFVRCALCDDALCKEHLQDGYCKRCSVACPSCKAAAPKADLTRCGGCGRRFCPACLPAEATACLLCRAGA